MLANIIRNRKKTAIGGGGGGIVIDNGDPFYSAVSMLLPMDGADGSTTFTDASSNAIALTATGSPQISTSQSKFGGASALFPTNQSYLTAPSSSLWAFGTGDFTVEFWIYIASNQNSQGIIGNRPNAVSATTWQILFWTTSNRIEFHSGAAVVLQSTSTVSLNTWTHVAFCRSSGTLRVFLNGVQAGSVANANNFSTEAALNIGRDLNVYASSNGIVGNIDDLRISKFARYVSNFTPPTAALPTTASSTPADPYYGYTSLLLHMDGSNASTTFTDSGPSALTVTAYGTAQISTSQNRSGFGQVASISSGGNVITTPFTTALNFGAADFTIEMWVYFSVMPSNSYAVLLSYGNSGASQRYLLYLDARSSQSNPGLRFSVVSASNSLLADFSQGGNSGWSANTWYFVTVTRNGSSWRLFRNGIQIGSTYTSSASIVDVTANGLVLGAEPDKTTGSFSGLIDDLRITKYARYTSAFAPPAQAFPNIYNPYASLPVSGAALWLDASQQSSLYSDAGFTPVTTSGQAVYQWNDLSGNNRHAVQATSGNRPTWVPPASGQNGLGAIGFNGSSSFFDTSMSLNGISSFSIFLVVKSATSGGWQSALRQQSGYQGYFVMPWTGNGGAVSPRIILAYDGGTTTTNTVTLTNGVFNLISFIRTSGTSNVANVGGSLSSTRSANSASLSESVNLSIGRYPQPVAEYFSGSIAEIVIFNRALSASETAFVESYLKTKWGTP